MKNFIYLLITSLYITGCTSNIEENYFKTDVTTRNGLNFVPNIEMAFPDDQKELITLANGVVIEKIDSLYILQSDIILTQEQVDKINNHNQRSAYSLSAINYWPNRTVFYTFATNFTYQTYVKSAIAQWEQNTGIKFIETSNSEDYIEFFHGEGNYSSIGKIGGKQKLSLAINDSDTGTAMHEIGHAMGLFHEQSRSDRDNYITILWDNIKPDRRHNFQTFAELGYDGTNIGTFDFNSIMLYSSYIKDTEFVYDPNKPAMQKKDGSAFYGQRLYLSQADIEGIKAVYGPPFHKLETKLSEVVLEDFNSSYDRYEYKYSNKICFYADESFTIRAALTYPRAIKCVCVTTTLTDGKSSTQRNVHEVIVPAGSTSFYLRETTNKMESIYGIDNGYTEQYYISQ